jgi:hypothetical protein
MDWAWTFEAFLATESARIRFEAQAQREAVQDAAANSF